MLTTALKFLELENIDKYNNSVCSTMIFDENKSNITIGLTPKKIFYNLFFIFLIFIILCILC